MEGFSGPLDLLCHLIEIGEMDILGVRLASLIQQYGLFLTQNGRVPLSDVAEFFSVASKLLMGKLLALVPRTEESEGNKTAKSERAEEDPKSSLPDVLERYRPYRSATLYLARLKAEREHSFSRETEEGPLCYELGDLYLLASLWWDLFQTLPTSEASVPDLKEEGSQLGVPPSLPEEAQVEARMRDIQKNLSSVGQLSLESLIDSCDRAQVVVTLLALLELARLQKIYLKQEVFGGDVLLFCA